MRGLFCRLTPDTSQVDVRLFLRASIHAYLGSEWSMPLIHKVETLRGKVRPRRQVQARSRPTKLVV